MKTITFELKGRQFKMDALTGLEQFHLMRRVSPMIPPLAAVLAEFSKDWAVPADKMLPMIAKSATPFTVALSNMTNEDAEKIFAACLAPLKILNGDTWVGFWNAAAKRAAFDEYDNIATLLPAVVRVIQENLGGFFADLVTTVSTGAPPTQTTAPTGG